MDIRQHKMTAHETYTTRRAQVDDQIAALQAALARLDADHDEAQDDWRIVGDLGEVHSGLEDVLDFMEGE